MNTVNSNDGTEGDNERLSVPEQREEATSKVTGAAPPGPAPPGPVPADAPAPTTPAAGTTVMPDADFKVSWDKYDRVMASTSFLSMARRLPGLLRLAWHLGWQADRAGLIASVVLQLLTGVIQAAGLLAVTGALTAVLAQGPTLDRLRDALPSLIVVVMAGVFRSLLTTATSLVRVRLTPRIDRISTARLLELATRTPVTAFDDPKFVDDLEAAERGAASGRQLVGNAVDVLTSAVELVAVGGVLGVLHPVLLPLLIVSIIPQGWASVRSARIGYASFLARIRQRRRAHLLASFLTSRDAAAEVRSFVLGDFLLDEYTAIALEQEAEQARVGRRQAMFHLTGDALAGTVIAAVYVTLVLLLNAGLMPLAAAGTAVLAIRTGRGAMSSALLAVNNGYENFLYFNDYQAWTAEATARMPHPRHTPAPADPEVIRVENVTYTYPRLDEPALRDVSMELHRGEVVALVGENGSGKSTLSKILAGLYEPDRGRVTWDGVDLTGVDPDSVREQIAVIPQEYTEWPMSARLNIAVGRIRRLGADGPDSVVPAARATGADSVINDLPHGYDTLLARQYNAGHDLSGGQWQRIACARAVYREAPILIADEPSAALDARAENQLFSLIRDLAEGRTVVLITHRLASVRQADRIYVLERGCVIDEGTHEQLMARGGLYAELFGLQASQYAS